MSKRQTVSKKTFNKTVRDLQASIIALELMVETLLRGTVNAGVLDPFLLLDSLESRVSRPIDPGIDQKLAIEINVGLEGWKEMVGGIRHSDSV